MTRYDVFICYRRSASESAQMISSSLKALGYNVFIDIESLRSGKFNDQLYNVIDKCKDFIVVLPEGALDRCESKDDWVRLEIQRALYKKKNIIPVMLSGFKWNDPMPQGLEDLKDYQAISASSSEYFDLSMKRLEGYLKSVPLTNRRKIIIWLLMALFNAFILIRIANGGFFLPFYTKVVDNLTMYTNILSLIGDNNNTIENKWSVFLENYHNSSDVNDKYVLIQNFTASLTEEKERLSSITVQLKTLNVLSSKIESFQLKLRHIDSQEVYVTHEWTKLIIRELESTYHLLDIICSEDYIIFPEEEDIMEVSFREFHHYLNLFYYSYLSTISRLPEKSLGSYRENVSNWHSFPNDIGLHLERTDYDELIRKENKEISNIQDSIINKLYF